MYEDVVRFWMEKEKDEEEEAGDLTTIPTSTGRHPSDEVLSRLHLYGPTHPELYPLVLRFLTSSNGLLARHAADLKDVLETIDEERIMPTLEVVQVLSRNGVASVGVVKDWLREKVRGMRVEVESVSSRSVFLPFPPLLPLLCRASLETDTLLRRAGQNPDHLLPHRDPRKANRDRHPHRPLQAARLPGHPLHALQPDTRSAQRALHVQALVSSAVSPALRHPPSTLLSFPPCLSFAFVLVAHHSHPPPQPSLSYALVPRSKLPPRHQPPGLPFVRAPARPHPRGAR